MTTPQPVHGPLLAGGPQSSWPSRRKWNQRYRRSLLVLAATGVVAVSLAFSREPLVIVAVFFVLVVPFEKMFPRHEQRVRRPQVGTDISYALAGPVLNAVGLAAAVLVGVLTFGWVPGLMIRPLVSLIPGSLMPIVGVVLFDAAIYWTHRWYHEVPVLWRFHSIHHSPEQMDWISGFRAHPFDGTLIAPAFLFLLAAGFSAEFTGVLAIVQIISGLFLHANVRWRLRPLHRLIITPEFHHWHHANEPDAIHSNYAVFLPVWDMIFGTYWMPKDRRPQVYGVDEFVPTGMAAQLRHPLRGTTNPLRGLRHPIRSARSIYGLARRVASEMWSSARRPRHSTTW